MTVRPSVFSFFAGAGFLDLGFEEAGYDVVFVNELHGSFVDAYRYSRRRMGMPEAALVYQGDIKTLQAGQNHEGELALTGLLAERRSAGGLIGFIGGSPCPDFATGGKNRGRFGVNGGLSETYVQLVCQRKPDFFLLENVKGLYRTQVHRAFFDELKARLHASGYVTSHRLVSSLEYGVPQNRERIILLGLRRDTAAGLGLSGSVSSSEFQEGVFPWRKHVVHQQCEIMRCPWPITNPFSGDTPPECPSGVIKELTVEHWFMKNSVHIHPNSTQFFRPRRALHRFETIAEGDTSRKSFKRLHRWRYSPAACYGNNEVHLHPYQPRRLSVAEALAVQSLPPSFSLPPEMTLSDAFKAVGNGVPFLVAKAIAVTLREFLEGRT